jgi:Uri superfamily endonuclease
MITYVLLIKLEKDRRITVGELGEISFRKGCYAYVGSARRNMGKRLERHQRREKKLHWHIDYLLKESRITRIFVSDGEECEIARALAPVLESVPRFGCSDCSCGSHLFYSGDPMEVELCLGALGGMFLTRWKDGG